MNIRTCSRINTAVIAFLSLMLLSCAEEQLIESNNSSGHAKVTVVIKSPGAGVATKALTEAEENDVQQIDVLLFDPNDGIFFAAAESNEIDNSNSELKNFTVELYQGTFDMVILANARNIITSASFIGKTKEEALSELQASLPAGDKWSANKENQQLIPFPMWGDAGTITIQENKKITDPVQLLRMVARVDIQVAENVTNFQLRSVDVYNYNTTGALVPKSQHLTTENGLVKATAPNIPASSELKLGPIQYNNSENSCQGEIYLFEAENLDGATVKGLTERTCLVIGGVWNNTGNFTGQPTYYRVDFAEDSGTAQKFMNIIRNKKYIINITKVSGDGYSDSETAFKSGPFNITTQIVSWDESMNENVWNGQNELSVNQGRFDFNSGGTAQSLFIYTDYHEGWKIIDKPDWIDLDKSEGKGNETTEISITAEKEYTSQVIREGIIVIKAGTLIKNIKVTQNNDIDLSITIDPATLTLYANGGTRSVRITVSPDNASLTFTKASSGDMLLTLPDNGTSDTNSYQFTIAPHPDLTKGTLTTPVIVTAKDSEGNERQETIQVIQYAYNLQFEFTAWNHGTFGSKYPATGSNEEPLYFLGQTARTWEYKEASYNGFIPKFTGIQQPSETTPKEFFFDLEPNEGWTERPVTVTVTTTDVNIPLYDFTLWQMYTLPYIDITKPTGNPMIIDFGNDNTGNITQEVEFTTNAKWMMNSSGNNYDKIVSNATPTNGGDSSNSLQSGNYNMTLRGKVLKGSTGIPAAGSQVQATINLKTTDHASAEEFTTDNITLSRIIPAFFEYKSATPVANSTLPRTEAKVTVHAETNDGWSLTSDHISGIPATEIASAWANKPLSINIQNNDTWNNRPITVTYTQNGKTSQTLNYTQSGAYTERGETNVSSVSGTGGDVIVTVHGNYPGSSVKVRATLSDGTFSNGTKTQESGWLSAATVSSSATLNIPSNTTNGSRSIVFEYLDGTSSTNWKYIGTISQALGYNYEVSLATTGTLPNKNATVTLKVQGIGGARYPALTITAYDGNISVGSTVVTEGTGTVTPYMNISENTDENSRTITFKYIETYSGTEKTIGQTLTQDGTPSLPSGIILSTGRIVAATEAQLYGNTGGYEMNWAQALGIDPVYNTTNYPESNLKKYTKTHNTGCAVYEQDGYKGKWFAPTGEEVKQFLQENSNRLIEDFWEGTQDKSVGGWWSSSQSNWSSYYQTMTAWLVRPAYSGYTYGASSCTLLRHDTPEHSSDKFSVRCVWDPEAN